ncbi:hypothetical protein HPB51_000238 [Rhipicephalus microplus]|uniref:Uncharacterized protein n=1 Tax=Rhipicephalus microplus TaxID=6941 RepID=A0A9J6EVE4_RHIMP|nr:hypothetical protein HPB51_000238 [Rhipicephalus microplus]
MKSWPPLPARESTIIPQRLLLRHATPDISWGRWSRSAYSSWREISVSPREADQNMAEIRRTSRSSVSATVPLKPSNDRSNVDRRGRDRKPIVMVVWVILLGLATVALLLFSYEKDKRRGLTFRGGTASEDDAIRDPVNATRGHPNPRPLLHTGSTRRFLHDTKTTTELPAVEVITTTDDMTTTSFIWEPPAMVKTENDTTLTLPDWKALVNGTNATAVNETAG